MRQRWIHCWRSCAHESPCCRRAACVSAVEIEPEADADLSHSFRMEKERLVHELRVRGTVRRSALSLSEPTDDLQGAWWKGYLQGAEVTSLGSIAADPLRVVELFSGTGGLALGFSQACAELGVLWRSVAAVDQDADAVAVYGRHHGTRRTYTNSVSTLVDRRTRGIGESCEFVYAPELVHPEWADLVGEVDVVLAGPPCQGHSNLNNRTRRSDRRNELYLTVPAIAVAVGAHTVVIENVHAVVHDTRRVVQSTVALLRGAGYEITTGVVKASQMGWPQRRDRYFLVASRHRRPLDLASVSQGLAASPRDLWWAIGDLQDSAGHEFMGQQPEFSPENVARIDWLFENNAFDLPPAQRPDCHKNGTTYNSVYGRLYADRPAPTITTGFMTPGRGRYIHPTRRRVLTPREAARLQGFPDTYDFRTRAGAEPSKLQLGKWIGDAVPMPLGYAAAVSALAPVVA